MLSIVKDEGELRKPSSAVTKEDIDTLEFLDFVKEMIKICEDNKGIALAAPQLGVHTRVVVVNLWKDKFALINPQITFYSRAIEAAEEGCLSFPGVFKSVKRSKKIRVKALNLKGQKVKIKAKDLLARVIQHEVDHLDGV